MATRMQQRRGTATQWTTSNPILNAGEIGWESDSNKFKIGDGTNHWADLDYYIGEAALAAYVSELELPELAQDAINTAIVAGTGLDKTYNDESNTITLDIDSTVATKTYVGDAIAGIDLSIKQDVVSGVSSTEIGYLDGVTSSIQTQLNAKLEAADIADFATESYVSTAIGNVIDSAPAALDTLNELAAALGDDANYASTITTALSNKQDKVTGVSDTEIGYLDGVTSAIQTQLDAKINKSVIDAEGDLLVGTADNTVGRLAIGTSGYLLTSNGTTAEWAAAPATGPTAVEIVMGVY